MYDTEKYKKELLAAAKRAIPEAAPKNGGLTVIVTTLKGVFPIQNAAVTVFKGSISEGEEIERLYTDKSGKTATFSLPAPPVSLSLVPQSEASPFSLYNVSVHADGYRDRIFLNLPVFGGVNSMQSVNLIALNEEDKNSYPFTSNEIKRFGVGG